MIWFKRAILLQMPIAQWKVLTGLSDLGLQWWLDKIKQTNQGFIWQ